MSALWTDAELAGAFGVLESEPLKRAIPGVSIDTRTTAPGGTVRASTNSTGTLSEMRDLLDAAISALLGEPVPAPPADSFTTETGTAILNLRDAPHGGFKVVGGGPLKLFTVHVVDKGKPLYEWVN